MGRKLNARTRDRGSAEPSIRERAYLHIQRKIASGELEAGGAISELALAKEAGTSRTPIREALGQLVAEGLLEQTPNRGVVVVKLTRQDIVDLYELREALEVYAIGKAARHQPLGEDLERLRSLAGEVTRLRQELVDSGAPALSPQQMHRFVNMDLAFHAMLMRQAANARILKVVHETRLLIRIFSMRHRGHSAEELATIHQAHCALLAAVEAGDADRAQSLMAAHIQASQRERLEEFDRWDREHSLEASLPAFFNLLVPGV